MASAKQYFFRGSFPASNCQEHASTCELYLMQLLELVMLAA